MAREMQRRNGRDRSRDDAKSKELKPIKKLQNGSVLYSNFTVRGPVGRLSFVNFTSPKTQENDDGSTRENYGCAILFKRGENLLLLREACEKFAMQEKGNNAKRFKNTQTGQWSPLRLQDDKVDQYDGFTEGAYYFNSSSKYPPKCIGRNKEEIPLSAFYSGCWARLLFRPYLYDRKGNRGLGLGLAGAQFIRDDEPLGGGGYAPETWADDEGDDIDDTDGYESMDDYVPPSRAGSKVQPKAGTRRPKTAADEFL
jgi:hypothetical protein